MLLTNNKPKMLSCNKRSLSHFIITKLFALHLDSFKIHFINSSFKKKGHLHYILIFIPIYSTPVHGQKSKKKLLRQANKTNIQTNDKI